MNTTPLSIVWVQALLAASVLLFLAVPSARAEDSLDSAKTLYASASYEEALAVLGRLQPASLGESTQVDRYRAFCLIALGRDADAEQVMASMIAADPSARLTDADASPRVLTLFAGVRARLIPEIARQRFASAKAAYADKKYKEARDGFSSVLALLKDPAVPETSRADLNDLRVVVEGFAELAASAEQKAQQLAQASPRPATPVGGQPGASLDATPRGALPSASGASADDAIQAPQVINQRIPRPVGLAFAQPNRRVLIDLVINELGRVEQATIRESFNEVYDAMLLSAARDWRYRPATRGGRPVKYSKTLEIKIQP